MDIVLKILAGMGLVILEVIQVWACVSIIEDIRKFRETRKKEKESKDKEKNKHYPYLPFDPVTEHYGWSYESVYGKFKYIIWYHENGKQIHSVLFSDKKSRTAVEELCRGCEMMCRFPKKED